MHRRRFLTTGLVAATLAGTGKNLIYQAAKPKGFVVKKGKGRFSEKTNIGALNDIKISGKDTNGTLAVFEYTSEAKGGPPLHIHHAQDEMFFVQEGNFVFQLGDEKHNLNAGDTIFLPRKVPHTFAQLSDKGKLIYFFTPAGKMEDFFRTLGKIKGVPAPAVAAKIFEAHGMEIVGPPLAV